MSRVVANSRSRTYTWARPPVDWPFNRFANDQKATKRPSPLILGGMLMSLPS